MLTPASPDPFDCAVPLGARSPFCIFIASTSRSCSPAVRGVPRPRPRPRRDRTRDDRLDLQSGPTCPALARPLLARSRSAAAAPSSASTRKRKPSTITSRDGAPSAAAGRRGLQHQARVGCRPRRAGDARRRAAGSSASDGGRHRPARVFAKDIPLRGPRRRPSSRRRQIRAPERPGFVIRRAGAGGSPRASDDRRGPPSPRRADADGPAGSGSCRPPVRACASSGTSPAVARRGVRQSWREVSSRPRRRSGRGGLRHRGRSPVARRRVGGRQPTRGARRPSAPPPSRWTGRLRGMRRSGRRARWNGSVVWMPPISRLVESAPQAVDGRKSRSCAWDHQLGDQVVVLRGGPARRPRYSVWTRTPGRPA